MRGQHDFLWKGGEADNKQDFEKYYEGLLKRT
jgi:hypothetical protein